MDLQLMDRTQWFVGRTDAGMCKTFDVFKNNNYE